MADLPDPTERLAQLEVDNTRLRRLLDEAGVDQALRHGLRDTLAMLRAIMRQSAETVTNVEPKDSDWPATRTPFGVVDEGGLGRHVPRTNRPFSADAAGRLSLVVGIAGPQIELSDGQLPTDFVHQNFVLPFISIT